MYQYQNNILSIPAKLLYKDWKLMSYHTYRSYCTRGKLIRTKEGRGQDNQAWVSFNDLPVVKGIDTKEFCIRMLGKPEDNLVRNELEECIVPDPKAIDFFAQHRKPNGEPYNFPEQREKATNCMILNAIETILNNRVKSNSIFGKKKVHIWKNISEAVNAIDSEKWHYKLPGNPRSLKRRYNEYINNRYQTFIHKGEGSDNARLVTHEMERLFIALYCLPNKPYQSSVHDMYLQFLGGAIEVFDVKTGEIFNREEFYDDNDKPLEVSEATIRNYLNKPTNQVIISKYRNGAYDFSHKVRPHVNRHAPNFTMSKITLDDRDIMHTKMHDGKKVMAYYAFDDLSGAMIGIAHSKSKDHELFLDCIRNMFQFTANLGLGIPMQMEVEKHLVSDFSEGLMKANNIFPFVRWCNPTNSQEKYAERLIEYKKYGVEKDNNQNVGRHYARKDSNRVINQKVFDEYNDTYKFAKSTYDEIVAQELAEQVEYNNQPHPNKERFPGKTRLEVFVENINPNLPKLNKALLAQFIGVKVETSIRRSQYVTVQYEKYQLPSPQVLNMLASNNYNVDAYYIPVNNQAKEVYLYQHGTYICECQPVPRFNRANAEWTDQDVMKYNEAMKYISQFDAMVKSDTSEKIQRVGILKNKLQPTRVDFETVEEIEENEEQYSFVEQDYQSQKNRAINDL